jgi:hypothetical protein
MKNSVQIFGCPIAQLQSYSSSNAPAVPAWYAEAVQVLGSDGGLTAVRELRLADSLAASAEWGVGGSLKWRHSRLSFASLCVGLAVEACRPLAFLRPGTFRLLERAEAVLRTSDEAALGGCVDRMEREIDSYDWDGVPPAGEARVAELALETALHGLRLALDGSNLGGEGGVAASAAACASEAARLGLEPEAASNAALSSRVYRRASGQLLDGLLRIVSIA